MFLYDSDVVAYYALEALRNEAGRAKLVLPGVTLPMVAVCSPPCLSGDSKEC